MVYYHQTASSTGSGLEVLTETNDDVMPCDAVRTAEGKFIGRCRNKEATHLRIRTRDSLQICEVAVLGRLHLCQYFVNFRETPMDVNTYVISDNNSINGIQYTT